ncbi:C40 family peptidase [Terrisporobacter hibernicus]|uniref:C40 family peptidase n=2 Tax=Terrisporobacter hibernicus TaxID=2813371 RepID=A0AAX2ZNW0_9FIRM|nr:C40 family peptidase [Terrisporobacter hibernicus]
MYLANNEEVYNFKNKTAKEIAKKVCGDYKISMGSLASPNYKFNKKFMGATLYDIIMTAYSLASAKNSKKYMTTFKKGKLHVIEKGTKVLEIKFENGKNIISSQFEEDASNIKTKVKVIDDNGKVVYTKVDKNLMKLCGCFQKVVKKEEGKSAKEQASEAITDVEKKASIKGFGDTSCVTGYGVHVKDSSTGLTGLFYIDQDKHTWENGVYSIELTLDFKNIMNEVDASESESKSSKGSSGGKEVKAQFTAYYPSNSKMEGGYYDAQGKRLNPSKRTCAAPKLIPFGTKIKVQGTGTSCDGKTYTVTDRGGAIKIVNGVYKIDILMKNAREANKFGRRKGTAIIGGGSSSSSSPSGKTQKVINMVKSKLGCKYVWGAQGPNRFDCSGLMWYCFKNAAGKNLPRTSKEQSKVGTKISRSNLQAGDMVFFNTHGSGVSHVGLYIGDGYMIHAPKPGDVVKKVSINSSYYKKKFVIARRVL